MKHLSLYILPALAVLLGFTACSTDDSSEGGPLTGDEVIVKAAIGAGSVFTRSNPIGTKEEQAKFNSGDQIEIYDESGNYATYKYSGSAWNFDTEEPAPGQLLKWNANEKTFYAAYPLGNAYTGYNHYGSKNDYYSQLNPFQNSIERLARNDIMYADTTMTKPDNHTLTLNFKRQTARVILKFTFNEQFDDKNASIGDVSVNGNYTYSSRNPEGNRMDITPYHAEDGSYIALVFPQTEDKAQKFLDLAVNSDNGEKTSLTLTGAPALEKGKSYTFSVKVGKEQMSIESVTVNPWTDKGSIGEGEATDKVALTLSANLDTEANGYEGLKSWLETNVGDETGYTVALTGAWTKAYCEAIASFTRSHLDADLTVDLSGVTGLTSFDNFAFNPGGSGGAQGSFGLTGIILPSTVTSIGNGAFQFTGLKSINLPEGITSIGRYAFANTDLTTLTVPSTLTTVGDDAFESIDNLREIHFKGNVVSLGKSVFNSDRNLQAIYLDNCTGVPGVVEGTFNGLNEDQNITVYVKDAGMKTNFEATPNWENHGFTFVAAQ